jgi:hypothetical protein
MVNFKDISRELKVGFDLKFGSLIQFVATLLKQRFNCFFR